MAYGTEAQLEAFLGESLMEALATFTGDGAGDPTTTNVIDQARDDADGEIDAALGRRYAVPFAQQTDTPSTPQIIETISHNLTAANLFQKRHAAGVDYTTYREVAETMLARILEGTYIVPGASDADTEDATSGFVTRGSDINDDNAGGIRPTFAGIDSEGDDRMGNW